MIFSRNWLLPCSLGLAVLVAGCGEDRQQETKAASVESGHDHAEEEEEEGAVFKAGRGLRFSPDVLAALRLRTVQVEAQSLSRRRVFTAQVFAGGTTPRAVSAVSPAQAAGLVPGWSAAIYRDGQKLDQAVATLTGVSRTAEKASGQVELLFTLLAVEPPLVPGDDVEVAITRSEETPVLTVPPSALLETATGTFVYVVRGDYFLRTEVQLGAVNADAVGITAGLTAGDSVVADSLHTLWLSELRLTKGGGHSH